jgi:hypothetical protein
MDAPGNSQQEQLDRLLGQGQEAGVAQAIATYEAVEEAYFQAVSASTPPAVNTTYTNSTAPR